MFKFLLKPVTDLAGIWLTGKVEEKKADSELKLATTKAKAATADKVAKGEIAWDQSMAEASADSWKDEWLTILISIPLVLAFTGHTAQVTAGFEALDAMPSYYQTAVGVVFAASFGIKKLTRMLEAKKRS